MNSIEILSFDKREYLSKDHIKILINKIFLILKFFTFLQIILYDKFYQIMV